MDRNGKPLPICTQVELLEVSRSGIYYRPVPVSAEELCLKHRIDEIYTQHPYYGARRIAWKLCEEGWRVSRKRVGTYMEEMGLVAVYPGPNLSKRVLEHHIYPYLLRGVAIVHPNHVWGVDITYIRLRAGWMYLMAVLDWFSRYVVAWELGDTLEQPLVTAAMTQALQIATPGICNSDQGGHFTSSQYVDLLVPRGVRISMDGKKRAIDNIFTERLWRTIKYEEVYLNDYDSPRTARQAIASYLAFYNNKRPHQSLGYRTPAQVYGLAA